MTPRATMSMSNGASPLTRTTITCAHQEHVVIPNPASFAKKRQRIIDNGFANLQVIADFDRTLTMCRVNGKTGASCHGVMESLETLSKEYREQTGELFKKYYPIEICHNLTIPEKIPIMEEWYSQAHELLLREGVTLEHIRDAVMGANLALRPGVCDVIKMLQCNDVPFLIFSAGIANVISEVLKQKFGELKDSTHVVSNWMYFDKEGSHNGFSEPLIHMFNKNESQTKGTDYRKAVEQRQFVILLGDGLGDVTMAEGIPHEVVLKVGFLNDKVEELLPLYKEVYDIIVTNDGSMDVVVELLREIPARVEVA
uniref:5'-nucleotidase n=1 Tax=Pyramimonas obovata TaxID=1411642 RepID=A0A7S0WMC1_9CHLO|mmetsp:Transcript_30625/g.66841  ORF Transcript_30625/g.66841 Transcript_30625/m.66841 type:complete len:312 (+) Transcript_30625:264-1199(+)